MFANMSSDHHHIASNELNQAGLSNPYASPFIKPSLLANSQVQHQSFNTIVNPQLPIQSPNAFQLPPTVSQPQSTYPYQNHGFVPSNGVPWKCPDWMSTPNMQMGSYMNFNGQQRTRMPFKRKAGIDMESEIASKQMITEAKMAAQLNGLHISPEYTAHQNDGNTADNNMIEIDTPKNTLPCSMEEIEEKLKRAERITIHDVVKSIKDEPLLPSAIMERYEKPSKALVVWQPPQRLTDLILKKAAQQQDDEEENIDEENNNKIIDISYETNESTMELDF